MYVDAETHDKAMAVNQVLHHMVYELYSRAAERLAERLGVEPAVLKELVTWSLKQTMSVASRLENLREVVLEIRRLNPYSREALEALREALETLETTRGLGGGDNH